MTRFVGRAHASTKGFIQVRGALLLKVLSAGEVHQDKGQDTRADFSMPAAPSRYDRPGKFPIFRENSQFKPYLQGYDIRTIWKN